MIQRSRLITYAVILLKLVRRGAPVNRGPPPLSD
jgi:hypothetical protein